MNPETTMPSNNGDKEEVEGTIIRYKPTLETIYETSEGYSEMLPDRQVVSAKKLKPTRIPRAQRRRPQERASISEETMIHRAILAELEEMDKHWENLAKLFSALVEVMKKKRKD